ncbi:uncharacterized protein TRAVEDRAFT_123303, partial [Trametes versicolor FP-101664 SS1]|uniref:uncharacterized protein n=1 Tax=Trametes versicolor (strain FP-101664) TaxID=717944 RepID=UPI000462416D
VISTPMDLPTMFKKVKQRQHKFMKEFKDDLDLIWSNCFTYNATEGSAVSEDPTAINTPTSRGTTSRPNSWNSRRGSAEVRLAPDHAPFLSTSPTSRGTRRRSRATATSFRTCKAP